MINRFIKFLYLIQFIYFRFNFLRFKFIHLYFIRGFILNYQF